jgi:hypothetical protein
MDKRGALKRAPGVIKDDEVLGFAIPGKYLFGS